MKTPISHILFPTDFSDAADNAFRYCLEFASLLDARVSVLHTYSLPAIQELSLPKSLKAIYDDIYLEEFNNFKDEIPHLQRIALDMGYQDIELDYLLEESNDIQEMILKKAHNLDVDLIVMGTQGASLVERYFIGNNTSNIMERAAVPVLGVPPNAIHMDDFTSIVMCTDFSDNDRKVLEILKNLFPDYIDSLITVHFRMGGSSTRPKLLEEWKSYVKQENVAFHNIDAHTFIDGIMEYDVEYGIDVLVMRTHERSAIFNLFNRDIAKNVIYSKTVPVLAIPEKYWK